MRTAHLPSHEGTLPVMHLTMACLYLMAFLIWTTHVRGITPRSGLRVKVVVAVLFFLRAVTSLIQASRYHILGEKGRHYLMEASHTFKGGISTAGEKPRTDLEAPNRLTEIYLSDAEMDLRALRGILLFVVTTILAIGWLALQPTHKPGTHKERILILIFAPIQSIAFFFNLVLDEQGIGAPDLLVKLSLGVDIVCFVVVLVLMQSITSKEYNVLDHKMDYKQVLSFAVEERLLDSRSDTNLAFMVTVKRLTALPEDPWGQVPKETYARLHIGIRSNASDVPYHMHKLAAHTSSEISE
ncbi:hypothetical protein CYMTET_13449 [Cymbomonas tetramitiformis]|uniref:Transmembrane protein n=1 Tax=Cymbomonas tetramitiformis TaxID=36881 RepID=A0AAE0LBD8_9CHLO|nr:hypothetical protein CYMTET_13449 [Cymbomonas tetramitiformis]